MNRMGYYAAVSMRINGKTGPIKNIIQTNVFLQFAANEVLTNRLLTYAGENKWVIL